MGKYCMMQITAFSLDLIALIEWVYVNKMQLYMTPAPSLSRK